MSKLRPFFFYLSLLINVIFVLQLFASLSGWNLYYFFNSDGLYMASIYKDLFVDKTGLQGWNINASPNFFPEWPAYFLIRFISGDFRIAGLLYAILAVVSINFLSAAVLKIVFKTINYSYLTLINLGYTLLLMVYLYHGDFPNVLYLLTSGYHLGVFIMSLLSFLFFFAYLKNGKTLYAIMLFVIVFLGVLSDRMLIMHYVVPALSALLFIKNKILRKRIVVSGIIGIMGAVAGMYLYMELKSSDYIYIISLGYKATNFANVPNSFVKYIEILGTFWNAGGFKLTVLLFSLLSMLGGAILVIGFIFKKGNKLADNSLEKILITLFTAYIIIVALTPVVNGTFGGLAHIRFNYYAFCIGLSFFVVLYYLFSRKSGTWLRVTDYLTILLLGIAIVGMVRIEAGNNTLKGLKNFANYYPEQVEKIDILAKEHHLKYGVGTYWQAKFTTMFSKEDVRIYTVLKQFKPWKHVTNQNWYLKSGKGRHGEPEFNFILLNDLELEGPFYDTLCMNCDTLALDDILILKTPAFGFDQSFSPFLINENP